LKKLAILGAGGHGKVVADSAESIGWENIVFFDDAWPNLTIKGAWAVVGNTENLLDSLAQFDGVIVAVGCNQIRLHKQRLLVEHGANVVSIIHPRACISQYVGLGIGTVVMAGAVINVDSKLGDACIVNTGCTIDHDCLIGDAVHISPGANLAGGVVVGNESWIGIGSSIRQLIIIGEKAMVGAGAVVVDDVIAGCTVTGIPASVLSNKA